MYPKTEMDWEIMKAFFFPINLDMRATMGMTKKVVDKALILPKSVGHIPAAPASPLNK